MIDVFAQVTICEINRRPTLLYVVLFGTVCIELMLEAREQVTNASQECNCKLLN